MPRGARGGRLSEALGRGWGIWCQADVIVGRVREKRGEGGEGEVIGEGEGLRVLGWMGEARKLGGIVFDSKLEGV